MVNEIDMTNSQKLVFLIAVGVILLLVNALARHQKPQEARRATKNISEGNYTPENKKLSNANYGAYIQTAHNYYN